MAIHKGGYILFYSLFLTKLILKFKNFQKALKRTFSYVIRCGKTDYDSLVLLSLVSGTAQAILRYCTAKVF